MQSRFPSVLFCHVGYAVPVKLCFVLALCILLRTSYVVARGGAMPVAAPILTIPFPLPSSSSSGSLFLRAKPFVPTSVHCIHQDSIPRLNCTCLVSIVSDGDTHKNSTTVTLLSSGLPSSHTHASPSLCSSTTGLLFPGTGWYHLKVASSWVCDDHHDHGSSVPCLSTVVLPVLVQYVRKEIRDLDADELSRFFSAVRQIKLGYRNHTFLHNHDNFVAHHAMATLNSTVDQAHKGPAFLLWHAVFMLEYERAIQEIDNTLTLPFWDWSIEHEMSDPATESPIFSSKYYGATNNSAINFPIVDGPFADWQIAMISEVDNAHWDSPSGLLRSPTNGHNQQPGLTRHPGPAVDAKLWLGNKDRMDVCMQKALAGHSFASMWCCIYYFDTICGLNHSDIEGPLHGLVHVWTGGSWQLEHTTILGDLMDLATSPNDPLFFLHHSQVERIYWQWRVKIGDGLATKDDPCGGFPTGVQSPGHNLHDIFTPHFFTFGDGQLPITLYDVCQQLQSHTAPYTYEY